MNVSSHLTELVELTDQLANLIGDLAVAEQQALDTRTEAWVMSPSESVSGKDREAAHSALPYTKEVIDLKAQVQVAQARIDTNKTIIAALTSNPNLTRVQLQKDRLMAAGTGSTEYIDFTDFTAGVRDGYQTAPSQLPASTGFATRGTYGCYGHPGGGLFPLPKVVEQQTHTITTEGITRPTNHAYQRVLATGIFTPMRRSGYSNDDPPIATKTGYEDDEVPDLLFWAFGDVSEDPEYEDRWVQAFEWWKWERFTQNPTVNPNLIWGRDEFFDPEFSGSGTEDAPRPGLLDSDLLHLGLANIVPIRTHDASTAEEVFDRPGAPTMMLQISPAQVFNAYEGTKLIAWPSIRYDTPVNGFPTEVLDGLYSSREFDHASQVPVKPEMNGSSSQLIYHQGRLLASRLDIVNHNMALGGPKPDPYPPVENPLTFDYPETSGGVLYAGESWVWSRPNEGANDWENVDYENQQQLFGPSVPSGISCAVSTTSGELLIVRHTGGGTVVRGDMSSGQAIELPNLPSGHGDACIGVSTPLGFIYGTRYGVWSWDGGPTAQLLSPTLEGNFWVTPQEDVDRDQSKGKFNYTHPFIFAPNGWVMDVRTNGWFRLTSTDDEQQFVHWESSVEGHLWGFRGWVGERVVAQTVGTGSGSPTGCTIPSTITATGTYAPNLTFSTDFPEAVTETIAAEWASYEVGVTATGTPPDPSTLTFTPGGPPYSAGPFEVDAGSPTLTGSGGIQMLGFVMECGTFYYTVEVDIAGNVTVIGWDNTEGWVALTDTPTDLDIDTASTINVTAENDVLCERVDIATETSTYKWVSQPIVVTRNRDIKYRNIAVVLSGSGTVKVKVEGYDDAASQEVTFTVNSTKPVIQEESIGVDAEDAIVTITGDGVDSDSPAPRVHRLSLGYHTTGSVPDAVESGQAG